MHLLDDSCSPGESIDHKATTLFRSNGLEAYGGYGFVGCPTSDGMRGGTLLVPGARI